MISLIVPVLEEFFSTFNTKTNSTEFDYFLTEEIIKDTKAFLNQMLRHYAYQNPKACFVLEKDGVFLEERGFAASLSKAQIYLSYFEAKKDFLFRSPEIQGLRIINMETALLRKEKE